jgi:threonine aldolase
MDVLADLRSDTFTRPGPGMREFMAKAEVGDDMFGEDPTVRELEQEVAGLTGFEAALFVPSGTMANQIAIHLHTRPGDSVLIESESHVFFYEAGAGAALSGVQFDCIASEDFIGWTDRADTLIREDNLHSAPTSLIVVENTHNRHGGRLFPEVGLERIRRCVSDARLEMAGSGRTLALHCDGARIWNAAVASGRAVGELLRGFDSAAVCFSKGLGAPVGSALCGSARFISHARKVRKRWGGAMRQSGIIAAGALYALRHNRERLAEDHRHAALLAGLFRELCREHPEVVFGAKTPEPCTNMVYLQVAPVRLDTVLNTLRSAGVLALPTGGGWIRAVTHLDIPAAAMPRVCDAFRLAVKA